MMLSVDAPAWRESTAGGAGDKAGQGPGVRLG